MAALTLPGVLLTGAHGSRPAASAVGSGALYSCTDHGLLYQSSGSAWSTWATLGGGIADQGAFTYLDATEGAAPATPASGKARIYAKADGRIYSKDDAGVEYGPFSAAGGASDPLLYVDDIALHADGDNFTTTALTGWTLSGIDTGTEVTAVTNQYYDATCLDVVFAAQGDRMYKAIDSGDWTYYLTIHGITNSTPSPLTATNAMLALTATDDSGTGTGMSLYSDAFAYMWGVASHIYSSSGSSFIPSWPNVCPAAAANWPVVYSLSKSSSTITGGVSFNGGASFITTTRSDSTTFTRIGIYRLNSGGGTAPTLRLGRFNLVP